MPNKTELRQIAKRLRAAIPLIAEGEEEFICFSIARCIGRPICDGYDMPATRFLAELGMPTSGGGFTYFDDERFKPVPHAQVRELRVSWLEFAADLAEEWSK